MSQRIPLEVDAFFEEGEKLSAGELVSLGIEATARHRIIQFDDWGSIRLELCCGFSMAVMSGFGLPFFILFFPCIVYNCKRAANRTRAIMTDKKMVLRAGYYEWICCGYGWKQTTSFVRLSDVRGVTIKPNLCCIEVMEVEGYELTTGQVYPMCGMTGMVGVRNAKDLKTMIEQVRDAQSNNENNTLLESTDPPPRYLVIAEDPPEYEEEPVMNNATIRDWLAAIELSLYHDALVKEGYETVNDLHTLTASDLRGLNITKQMHVKKILKKITEETEELNVAEGGGGGDNHSGNTYQ